MTPKTLFRRTLALFAFVMSGSLLAADPVVVSSKIDTEGSVLGQMKTHPTPTEYSIHSPSSPEPD